MSIFLRGDIEKEIERLQSKFEKDFGGKWTKTNTVRKILEDRRKGEKQ
jgi:hypothetical protein